MDSLAPHDVGMIALLLVFVVLAFLVAMILDRRDTKRHDALWNAIHQPIFFDEATLIRMATMFDNLIAEDRRDLKQSIGIDHAHLINTISSGIRQCLADAGPTVSFDHIRGLLLEGFDAHERVVRSHFDAGIANLIKLEDEHERARHEIESGRDANAVEQLTGIIKHGVRDVLHDVLNGGAMNTFIDNAVDAAIKKRMPNAKQFEATVKRVIAKTRATRQGAGR